MCEDVPAHYEESPIPCVSEVYMYQVRNQAQKAHSVEHFATLSESSLYLGDNWTPFFLKAISKYYMADA